jgi:hypothetical protein
MIEKKRKVEPDTRSSSATKRVAVVEEHGARCLYLQGENPPPKPTLQGIQY